MPPEDAKVYVSESISGVPSEHEQPHAPTRTSLGSHESGASWEHEPPYADDMTKRELEVLRLITRGKSNQEIGQEIEPAYCGAAHLQHLPEDRGQWQGGEGNRHRICSSPRPRHINYVFTTQ